MSAWHKRSGEFAVTVPTIHKCSDPALFLMIILLKRIYHILSIHFINGKISYFTHFSPKKQDVQIVS
jgi:hypothetical protein